MTQSCSVSSCSPLIMKIKKQKSYCKCVVNQFGAVPEDIPVDVCGSHVEGADVTS